MMHGWTRLGLLGLVMTLLSCNAPYGTKKDTWITDCDTLTQELARISHGMGKDEVVRILGNESWVLTRQIGDDDVYRQLVLYNYNSECLKLRGQDPPKARRLVMIEYANERVDRIVDRPVNKKR